MHTSQCTTTTLRRTVRYDRMVVLTTLVSDVFSWVT